MCPLKRGVRLREVFAYRGSTVLINPVKTGGFGGQVVSALAFHL